jgi:dienelactone hydrolase/outer membrane lipoprotein-sorting protein
MTNPAQKLMLRATAALTPSLVAAALLLPRASSAQEAKTNSPSHYLIQAVNRLTSVLEPPASQAPRTFTTTLKISKAEGMPSQVVGREMDIAFQAPDHMRISGNWEQQSFVVCRDGQQLWVYSPVDKFGVVGLPEESLTPSATAADNTNNTARMGPLKLPFPIGQLALLPLFADVKLLPGEAVGTTQCRILKVTPKKEAIEKMKVPQGTVQLWLRESDSFPMRFGYRDDKGTDVQIDLGNPQIQDAWPEEKWKLKAGEGDKIVSAEHYFDNYDPSAPLNITVQETTKVKKSTPESSYTITKFTFDGYKGEKIPTLISLPMNSKEKKLPVIVFLHGIGQSKSFLREITGPFNRMGFAFVSFDQYMQGERKLSSGASAMASLQAFAERPAKTINETRRLIDYLLTRPDIDPKRIYLVGASYGAITGSTVLAKDKRLRAGIMVYGGGDFNKLLDSTANHLGVAAAMGMINGKDLNPEKPPLPKLTQAQERQVGMVLALVKPFASHFLGVADPIHYVDQISPTPVYFQNGTLDVLVPAAAGKALQDAAKEPKKITWYESDHVGIDIEQTKQVLEDGLKWLLEQDDQFRPPAERGKALPPFEIDRG